MKLNSLPPTTASSAKRLGRGYGSGKGGHTVGRGQKGQKTRGTIPAHFIGTSWVWFKRLPFMRGKSRFNALSPKLTLTLTDLNRFPEDAVVDLASLYRQGLISRYHTTRAKVKVVGRGQLTRKLTVLVGASASAAKAIKQAGGNFGKTE